MRVRRSYPARPVPLPEPAVLVVERDLAGVRLHDLLARAWPGVRRVDLRQLVASGEVSVNGESCVSDRRLRVGDVVLVPEPPRERGGGGRDASPRRA
ncbi:MAG: S4 domain-containing protein, partial [Planctomycetota bacterium]